jgi:hypothetical protein
MKRFFIIAILLFPLVISAQDNWSICSPGVTFFVKSDSSMKAFRLDSIQMNGVGDSVFYSYPAIGLVTDNMGCFDTTKGSILGRKIVKTTDNRFYLFNKDNDTVTILYSADLNTAWKFCPLTDNDYLQAKVTAIQPLNILGVTDQVKVITLQAKNNSGNDIPHDFNQKTILLSEHYGLAKMYDVNFIPGDTTSYVLAGKGNPQAGIQDISWKDVYNFDEGDVFEYLWQYSDFGTGGIQKSIIHVLQRNVHGAWDSVSYKVEVCTASDYGSPPVHETTFDTSWLYYNFLSLQSDPLISKLPFEYVPENYICGYYNVYQGYNKRAVKASTPMYYGSGPGVPCWYYLVGDGVPEYDYAKGLGMVYTGYFGIGNMSNNSLVYFQKGSETWGTPIASSCSSLVGMNEAKVSESPKITVFPDPVFDKAVVMVSGLRPDVVLRFSLTDVTGQTVFQSKAFTGSCSFDRTGMPSGIYVLLLKSDDGSVQLISRIILK